MFDDKFEFNNILLEEKINRSTKKTKLTECFAFIILLLNCIFNGLLLLFFIIMTGKVIQISEKITNALENDQIQELIHKIISIINITCKSIGC